MGTIISYSSSDDIQKFVQQHKIALTKFIAQIRQKLSEDIKHIEDVLNNSTKEITKKVPAVRTKIYYEFLEQIRSKVRELVSLPHRLDYIFRQFIDAIHTKLKTDLGYYLKNLQADYLSYVEKLPRIAPMINNLKITSSGIGHSYFIKYGAKFEDAHRKYLDKYKDALISIWAGKMKFRHVEFFVGKITTSHEIATGIRSLICKIISGLESYQDHGKGISYVNFVKHESNLSVVLRELDRLEKELRYIRRFDGVIKGINEMKIHYKKIDEFLVDDLKKFLNQIDWIKQDSQAIREQIQSAKSAFRLAKNKLRALSRYQFFLDSLQRKVDRFVSEIFTKEKRDQPQDLVDNIVNIKRAYDEVKSVAKHGYIRNITTNLGISDVSNWDGKLSKLSSQIGTMELPELKTQPYINKLKAIEKIQEDVEKIKKKKDELSSLKSKVSKITTVESLIEELGEIKSAIEKFSEIKKTLDQVGLTYYGAFSFDELGGAVKLLMTTKVFFDISKSHIESYIKFLEEIKVPSSELERIYSGRNRLPSIVNLKYNLGLRINRIIRELNMIRTKVSEMNSIRCELKLQKMKQNISDIKDRLFLIEKSIASILKVSDQMKSIRLGIVLLYRTLDRLEKIAHHILRSKSILTDTRISYTKPPSLDIRKSVRVLMEIKQRVDEMNLNTIQPIYKKLEQITSEINCLEQKIDSLMICFLKCSNKSVTKNTTESTKRLLTSGGQVYNNELAILNRDTRNIPGSENNKNENVWTVLSNMCIVKSKFVSSNLYESITITDEALKKISWVENCWCVNMFDFDHYIMGKKMTPDFKFEYEKSSEFHSKYKMVDWGNHLCICLVINNILYPNLMKCLCYLINMDFDTLCTISRKFEKYNNLASYKSEVSRFLVFVITVCMKISNWVYEKYASVLAVGCGPSICFCGCFNDVYYKYFISTILYISFLVENMFDHPNETTWDSIQSLSALKAELEHVKYVKRAEKSSSCNVHSTSIVIHISCYQLNSIVYYTGGKCNLLTDQIKGPNIYNKICCCKKPDGDCQNCQAGSSDGSCTCPVSGGGTSTNCTCNNQIVFTMKFIIRYVNKGTEDSVFENMCCIPYLCCLCKITCGVKNGGNCGEFETNVLKRTKINLFWSFKALSIKLFKLMPWQILNSAILKFMNEMKSSDKDLLRRMIETLKQENLVRITRENRIVDSTNVITNNKFEGPSDNNYTYNDAYRINTSRAHGSLKYIIIKIVLILIIVVMTIFIRVKIETDDEYKMDNLLSEENGMCECDVENNENGVQNGNQIRTTENGAKNNGMRKSSRTKGMKKKSLMIVMSIISGLYLNVVIRDLYVVLSLEYNVWSYFVSVVVCLGLTCSLLSRYCVHLYDFVYVLEQYGLKMSKVESLVDDKFGGESGTSMISSQFVMLYGLLKSVVGDLTSALSMSVSQSSYNEMKDELYPYKNMENARHK